ncbi:Gfo/Idh/MocA family protein [Mucilaginibacter myungsuensis]|uniref:Gfo/Idh/MocA family oxidoreductase n=1 Tax=Mucilaginibacter myungsuensis TaxID=649104 RepID=A0A929KWH5_9SPHI|nr:Gfo/Idh/MocA family oxidoreductase [Mucilaginibacter myungsuensis]MBE9661967.1 Gfo/Idh/MocA family oxidoreductase [Mucilaginibacter myungsuensis]MDN3599600.1 Gfo/Idh/MocA family oxidoreductase [Mucilaginibacter myungsuensis]
MERREFIKNSAVTAAGITILPSGSLFASADQKVRLGYIGVGARGMSHISEALLRDDVEIVAICDTQERSLGICRNAIAKKGRAAAKEFTGGTDAYKKLLELKDIDAVIISTPWQFHFAQAIDAMKAGKYVGCEVIAGLTVDEHWEIVRTSEKTGMPYMTLENVCYRRDVMAALNMVRQGLFGEVLHVEGGYQHDLRKVLFNDGKQMYGGGVEFGEKAYSEAQWRTQYNVDRPGDLYPTHGAGPCMNYLDINRGNRFTKIVSFGSKARGLAAYVAELSPGHPNAKLNYRNGDINQTMLTCANGETMLLTHDTHLPRPYSLGFRIDGLKGTWMDVNKSVYIEGKSKKYDVWDPAQEWFDKYDHPLWKKYAKEAEGAGHGGMDWYVFNAFITAVKQKKQTPIDVYDSVTMSVIAPLSTQSINEGNKTLEFPDFTKGKWKDRKNTFALDDSGL